MPRQARKKSESGIYHEEKCFDKCLDIEEQKKIRLTDEQAQKVIEKYSKCKNATEFQLLDIKSRDNFIKLFKEKGLSIRQIGRLTGIPKGIVERVLR